MKQSQAPRDATVPIDSGSENNDVFVQDGVAIDEGVQHCMPMRIWKSHQI